MKQEFSNQIRKCNVRFDEKLSKFPLGLELFRALLKSMVLIGCRVSIITSTRGSSDVEREREREKTEEAPTRNKDVRRLFWMLSSRIAFVESVRVTVLHEKHYGNEASVTIFPLNIIEIILFLLNVPFLLCRCVNFMCTVIFWPIGVMCTVIFWLEWRSLLRVRVQRYRIRGFHNIPYFGKSLKKITVFPDLICKFDFNGSPQTVQQFGVNIIFHSFKFFNKYVLFLSLYRVSASCYLSFSTASVLFFLSLPLYSTYLHLTLPPFFPYRFCALRRFSFIL